ncbi:hypothetical protein NHP21005_10820 [Helicobacter sp. NHP21005]|nr:hypothetical protein NHP21005_10820 [Helicobacter sp. NHP21005]
MPKAVRKKENTTIRRIKLVITKIKEGASTKRVKTSTTLRVVTNCVGVWGAVKDKLIVGITGSLSAAPSNTQEASTAQEKRKRKKKPFCVG